MVYTGGWRHCRCPDFYPYCSATDFVTEKLIQRISDTELHEYELEDDVINYRISGSCEEEELSVVLSALSAEPIKDGQNWHFVSGINREPLITLFVDLPDAETFASFVGKLQRRIEAEDFGRLAASNRESVITADQIQTTIRMLETYLDADSIKELLAALRGLSAEPEDKAKLGHVVTAFHALGAQQGPVLTYAPFFNSLLSSTDLDDLP